MASDKGLTSSLSGTSGTSAILLLKNWISWRLPSDTQLLNVNHLITVLDLLAQSADLILVHRPDLVESIFIALLKSLVLLLEEQEILGELFVVLGHTLIVVCEALVLRLEFGSHSPENFFVLSFPLLEVLKGLLVDLFSLLEHSVVELKLLFIKSVHSFHVFHALLKNLHFLLKLDLLLSLVISILGLEFLELISVLFVVLRPPMHTLLFQLLVLSEKLPDLLLIFLDDVIPFSQEGLLNLIKLLVVVNPHIEELLAHSFDQIIDVVILLFQSFHVFLILLLQLVDEAADQVALLRDYLFASLLLNFDVL